MGAVKIVWTARADAMPPQEEPKQGKKYDEHRENMELYATATVQANGSMKEIIQKTVAEPCAQCKIMRSRYAAIMRRQTFLKRPIIIT